MNQAAFNFGTYPQEFLMFIHENPAIWKRFELEADKAWNRGRRHYSAYTIVEYMRHETALAEVGGEFKINNNWRPWLARYYQEMHPDRAGLFETRILRKELAA